MTQNSLWRDYWRSLSAKAKRELAEKVGCSYYTLRNSANADVPFSTSLAKEIEKHTGIPKSAMRSDVWNSTTAAKEKEIEQLSKSLDCGEGEILVTAISLGVTHIQELLHDSPELALEKISEANAR